ncbi:TlpA family protein disulfide reductase [Arachidicoccus ginsenosidimutans]|uniref:TlpA family protein disulfide reductase n=1 Tax=Arachidicoccus sp. BS20 TaxID=1850526 RepID=UPI0018D2EE93|nr:TlpA disulfide reductase family protein [Arachidicoccus sp. BS20]
MKFKHSFLSLAAFGLLSLQSNAQSTQGRLQIESPKIFPGDTVAMIYHVDTAQFKAGQQIYLRAYIFDTSYHWSLMETKMPKMSRDSFLIKLKFPAPQNAGLIAFAMTNKAADTVDNNNDIGYYIMCGSRNNMFEAGAEAGYGLMRAPRYGYGVPEYFKNFSISDTAVYMWLSNEIIRHHESAGRLVLPYAEAISGYKHENAIPELRRAVNYLVGKEASDENYFKAWIIAKQNLKDTALADSIHNIAMQQYPNGLMKKKKDYQYLQSLRKPEDVIVAASAFLKAYPYHTTDENTDKMLNVSYTFVYWQLAACYIALGKKTDALKLVDEMPFDNLPEVYYKLVEIPYADWKTLPADSALYFSQPIFSRWNYFLQNKPHEYWYMSSGEWNVFVNKMTLRDKVIQARILLENNKINDALKMATDAQEQMQYSSADLNQTQATLFEKLKKKDVLHNLLVESVRHNQATSGILEMLRKEYVVQHKSDAGFDNYVESLKDTHTMELLREEVRKSAVNITAAPFSLQDQHGKTISLNELKGKTVVLDFWATWCAPCKASFSGMNMAKEYFKNDKDVLFFFIDTQETKPDYKKQTVEYVKSKGFDFHILYDTTSGVYQKYASLIHISGIPFKVIIDGNGQIRNTNVGYKGSPTGLKDEIVEMVKAAKEKSFTTN